jgi:hypothetical protein
MHDHTHFLRMDTTKELPQRLSGLSPRNSRSTRCDFSQGKKFGLWRLVTVAAGASANRMFDLKYAAFGLAGARAGIDKKTV